MTGTPNGNLLAPPAPVGRDEECFDDLLRRTAFRLERIVSTGQRTPAGEWLEQARAEWVVVVEGAARLRFEDEAAERAMGPGDHVLIVPGRRHRVEWTDPDRPTVWLALHFDQP